MHRNGMRRLGARRHGPEKQQRKEDSGSLSHGQVFMISSGDAVV
ncbi:MAG TPA: hypothetical protein PK706_09240 [Xanthobacteraceae bacterium]|jgi:hypothetical protein|nr:hypothetical protein [Xanthobacteraceae bacterium]